MPHKFRVCVFCGSSTGRDQVYTQAAVDLGHELARNAWGLVYGGGDRGCMGQLARAVVERSGPASVMGIIPRAMLVYGNTTPRIPCESQYGRTLMVSTMHERKSLMAKHSDAYVALPGGYGTIEELFEVITWNQIGIHSRPIVLFNVNGFFDALLLWIEHAIRQGMIASQHKPILAIATSAGEVVEKLRAYQPVDDRYMLDWTKL